MPRTPRPKAPDERPRRAAERRAGVRARELAGRLPEDRPADERLPDDFAPVERPPAAFDGVREPRAGAFPPLAVLRFLVADPAMPPR
ncbi:hypothetical protein GCM10022222_60810 [Amycolatopsis ultiminotia]|uniref:Uncharacterized protein n=1 Tax=Amycolatopsis ultiminotia TaxID=543629 RepID=A0ABP6XKK0_9PSEU